MEQALSYPYESGLVAAKNGNRIAWVRNIAGVRNVWVADGPAFEARQVTHYKDDDGQEITQLTFSPDGVHLAYVRAAIMTRTGLRKAASRRIRTLRRTSKR